MPRVGPRRAAGVHLCGLSLEHLWGGLGGHGDHTGQQDDAHLRAEGGADAPLRAGGSGGDARNPNATPRAAAASISTRRLP